MLLEIFSFLLRLHMDMYIVVANFSIAKVTLLEYEGPINIVLRVCVMYQS